MFAIGLCYKPEVWGIVEKIGNAADQDPEQQGD
jgi:hypothetical protein